MIDELRLGAIGADGKPFPLRASDIHQIETTLWKHSILCYQAELPARLRRSIISNINADNKGPQYLLLDRNIVTGIVNLFDPSPKDPALRKIAVAITLFIRLCKFTPGALTALQEYESQHPGLEAYNDVVNFGRALMSPIEKHLEVLNGDAACLDLRDVPSIPFTPYKEHEATFDFSSMWFVSYVVVLKLVALERDHRLTKIQRFEAFLQWIHECFSFAPPIILVASQFLGSRTCGSVIKSALTTDYTKLKATIRNAAWDLSMLLEWHMHGKRAEFCVLASRDAAMRKIAIRMRDIFLRNTTELLILSDDWPQKNESGRVLEILQGYRADLDNPKRPANTKLSRDYYKSLVQSLQIELGIS